MILAGRHHFMLMVGAQRAGKEKERLRKKHTTLRHGEHMCTFLRFHWLRTCCLPSPLPVLLPTRKFVLY